MGEARLARLAASAARRPFFLADPRPLHGRRLRRPGQAAFSSFPERPRYAPGRKDAALSKKTAPFLKGSRPFKKDGAPSEKEPALFKKTASFCEGRRPFKKDGVLLKKAASF